MVDSHRQTQKTDANPGAHDPIAFANRNTFCEQPIGVIMQPVQLSLVIGKKGSGVSTLLNRLRERTDMQGMLIIDEDGTNGIAPPLHEAWNSEEIAEWLKRHQELSGSPTTSHIVLAASDLRAPRHLLQALADDTDLSKRYRLSAVTFAIDAAEKSGGLDFDRAAAIADRIVLTKTDRVRSETAKHLASALKSLNPPAPILRSRGGDIGPARLVDSGLFDPHNGSVDIDRWLCEAAFNFEATRRAAGGRTLPEPVFSGLGNEIGVRFFAITLDQPIDSAMLSVFLKLLMADRGADLFRLKGIIATKDYPDRPALIDGREHIIQPLLWLPAWPTADRRARLVFSTSDTSETWIRTLLATLSDQLDLEELPALQLASVE